MRRAWGDGPAVEVAEDIQSDWRESSEAGSSRPSSRARYLEAAEALRLEDRPDIVRYIDTEGLALNCTPLGMLDRLTGEEAGVNATDEWGWTCLHKASIYGKADHIIALLDAGADSTLMTRHDPTQIYEPKATALALARCVQEQGWGDRGSAISMLETAATGRWVSSRSEAETRRLKRVESIRLRDEQMERDLEMVSKGEALMRMKLRQKMTENELELQEAVTRRDEAVEREEQAEAARRQAEEERETAGRLRAEAEAEQRRLLSLVNGFENEVEGLHTLVAQLTVSAVQCQPGRAAFQRVYHTTSLTTCRSGGRASAHQERAVLVSRRHSRSRRRKPRR